MSVSVDEIAKIINLLYPLSGASSWDNSGFQLNLHNNTKSILVCLDVNNEIIQEAVQADCKMIISHHPLLFNSIKNINSNNNIDCMIIKLIENGISLYSAHTSVDNALNGLNKTLSEIIGLNDLKFIRPGEMIKMFKISVVVPDEKAEDIRKAIYEAGGGRYGKYKESSFTVPGFGEFVPIEGAKPYKGELDKKEEIAELRIETLVEQYDLDNVIKAVKKAHPYEEPVIDIFELARSINYTSGSGIYGKLKAKTSIEKIIDNLKSKLHLDKVRVKGNLDTLVKTVGICGGAGGDLIPDAIKCGAELFITGEVKHNIYSTYDINILELGHYESEKCFCDMMVDSLQKALIDVKYKVTIRSSDKERTPYIIY